MKTAEEFAIAIVKAGNVTHEIAMEANEIVKSGTDSNFISAVAGANTDPSLPPSVRREVFTYVLREYWDEIHLDELKAAAAKLRQEESEKKHGDVL